MRIVSFGELLWDVYPDAAHIGGAPFNFAAHSARLGARSYLLSALGKDEWGTRARAELDRLGVFADYVTAHGDKETGRCLVSLDERSVPSYTLLRDVAYDYIPTDDLPDDFDVLYFGTLALRSEYNFSSLKRLIDRCRFREIFVDVNIRAPFFDRATVRFAVETATVLKISLEELPVVGELLSIKADGYAAFAKALSRQYENLNCVVLTLGADGAYALDCRTGRECACGCREVAVVSTVGAGDSFSAAFLQAYLKGGELSACLACATKIAEFVVSRTEAIPDYTPQEIL